MPPTVQGQSKREDHQHGSTRPKSDFVCRLKFNNSLPDIPFDAKFITYPFEGNRFVQYKPTSLEKNYKHELLTDIDLGVNIDLIDPNMYAYDPNATLDPTDEMLLEEDSVVMPDQKRTRHHNKNVSWLRKTEYISREFNRSLTSNEMAETKVGYSIRKKFKGTDLYKDRESQIAAIENTFDAAKKPIHHHPSKLNITPVEVLPVFPDFQMWSYACAHVVFDTDPTSRDQKGPAKEDEMSQAMIRGMVDASGDQFVAYFLPNKVTLGKRKRDQEVATDYVEDEDYEYNMAREYNWTVKNKATKGYEENYFFVFREGEGVFYNELVTRVRLSKRRARGGIGGVRSAVSKLVVKHRELNETEKKEQRIRFSQLEPTTLEEEEDEEDEGDEDEFGGDDESSVQDQENEQASKEDEEKEDEETEEKEEDQGEEEEEEGEDDQERDDEDNEDDDEEESHDEIEDEKQSSAEGDSTPMESNSEEDEE